ncbi:MAG: S-adenosylmethionine synthetase N-terminal domain-containing protein [Patescibacteria group bacterium]
MAFARVRGPGHPDQLCDLVAASIVEEYAKRDSATRINVRVTGGQGVMFVAGEVQSSADFDVSAVVRRVVALNSASDGIEPFIAFEPMAPAWAPDVGAREPISVFGYATDETPEMLPLSAALARRAADELERLRTQDPEWFWLGSDVDVMVEDHRPNPLVLVRAEHNESVDVTTVRENIKTRLTSVLAQVDVRVNVAGAEVAAGLAMRIGSSGVTSALDQYGTALPASPSGVGRHASHPTNIGAWLARTVAKELVAQGKGKAVMVHSAWLPLESRAYLIKARNERGVDLSKEIDPVRFDLARIPASWREPARVIASVRQALI